MGLGTCTQPEGEGNIPLAQTRQVKGKVSEAWMHWGRFQGTQFVFSGLVWRPNEGGQVAQAVGEVRVRQFSARTATQPPFWRKKPDWHCAHSIGARWARQLGTIPVTGISTQTPPETENWVSHREQRSAEEYSTQWGVPVGRGRHWVAESER